MEETTYLTTKDFIQSIELPAMTRSYKPVSHTSLIESTLEAIDKAGFTLERETYTSLSNGLVANGRYTISNIADDEMKLQIGWQNSLNKKISLKVAVGVQIIVN